MKARNSYLTENPDRKKKYILRLSFFCRPIRISLAKEKEARALDAEFVEQTAFLELALEYLTVADYKRRLGIDDWKKLREIITSQFGAGYKLNTRISDLVAFGGTVKIAKNIGSINMVNPTVTDMINLHIKNRADANDPIDPKKSMDPFDYWRSTVGIQDMSLVDIENHEMGAERLRILNSGKNGSRSPKTVNKFLSAFDVSWKNIRRQVAHLKLPVVPHDLEPLKTDTIISTGYSFETCMKILEVLELEDYQACTDPIKLQHRTFQHWQAVVEADLTCAIRYGALMDLHEDELNFDNPIVTVTKKMKGKVGKRIKTVAFSEQGSALLRERVARGKNLMSPPRDNEGWIFPMIQEDGKMGPFKGSKRYKKLLVRNGIPLKGKMPFHAFRKSVATFMGEAGADGAAIMRQLQHASIEQSLEYTENTQKALLNQTGFIPSFKKPSNGKRGKVVAIRA